MQVWFRNDEEQATRGSIRALLPRGEDEIHFSAGLGVAMPGFQIDLGVDFTDQVNTVSLSAIYSF